MTSKEFTLWLKGFTTACNEYSPTPKQWDTIKEELDKVNDTTIGFPFGTPNTTPNTHPFPTWQQPHYVDPYNPYKVTCTPGTTSPGFEVTTTPGYGSITISNPNLVSFGTGSLTTSTTGFPIAGSTVSYTTYQPYTTQTNDDLKNTKNSKFKKRKAKSVKEWEDEVDLGGGE